MTNNRVHDEIATHIRGASAAGTAPFIIGVTGPDASGKSFLASTLALTLERMGCEVQLVHVDDFHRPRAERYAGSKPEHLKYLEQSIDLDALVEKVLAPARTSGRFHLQLKHLDIGTDTQTITREYLVNPGSIVIVEGVFLLMNRVRSYLDKIIFLQVADEELIRRGTVRDAELLGTDVERRFREKYLPAQKMLFSAEPPEIHADIVVDNNDWQAPHVVRWSKK